MKLLSLLLLVIFALSSYVPAAESKKVTIYDALRPILKTKAKKHVKSLVKDDMLVWGVGLTNEQKAQIMDMLAGKKSSKSHTEEYPKCDTVICFSGTALHGHTHTCSSPAHCLSCS